jgi:ornithine cyclodeaminase/alanine dehydrogenase-like protein (mu-crystallin family)
MNMKKMLYLSRHDVELINLPMLTIIESLEEMFIEKGNGRVEMPPKPGIHPRPDSFIHAMPAFIPSTGAAGVKWVSGFPENLGKNLPYISGLLILNDSETGIPAAVMDCTWITAKRTGAATAVAAKYLARPESSIAGIVACGVQGRSNLEALASVFSLDRVKAFDIVPEVASEFASEMSRTFGFEVETVETAQEAVEESDLVVTSGPILQNPRPVIEPGWLKPGAFACPLDFDSYWKGSALAEVEKLATDDVAQLGYYRSVGYFTETPEPYADLGQIVAGKKPGRENEDERTISVNLGLALEDMATARLIYREAVDRGIGIDLEL